MFASFDLIFFSLIRYLIFKSTDVYISNHNTVYSILFFCLLNLMLICCTYGGSMNLRALSTVVCVCMCFEQRFTTICKLSHLGMWLDKICEPNRIDLSTGRPVSSALLCILYRMGSDIVCKPFFRRFLCSIIMF